MAIGIPPLHRPPPAVWLAAAGLLIGMPAIDAVGAAILHWSGGEGPFGVLIAPYVTALRALHAVTALLLAILLLTVRTPAAPGIAIVALWLEYPPLLLFFGGIYRLASSGGRVSWPPGGLVAIACLGPAVVTLYLLAIPSVRRFYGTGPSAVDARDPAA